MGGVPAGMCAAYMPGAWLHAQNRKEARTPTSFAENPPTRPGVWYAERRR